ncbi:acetyl-CoA carboxylase biotin carboxylase subunit [Alphaproteobacteria bacterium]|nr:acetyl-CoA carboxylase biotin carboxylase subunit [Alphaproteobacteria bacterium]GHS99128.1 acetyl-CoA carboxylase biotin carboxylase subunit [Alphaproteobacteria bacterium]
MEPKLFSKVLIANRGEIALRILRACQELNIRTVVVHSTADSDSMPVRLADESVCIGPAPSRDSYLNMRAIMSAAEITGADAIHPGVGFLSENSDFARMTQEHSLHFIGASPDLIDKMGDKIIAKVTMKKLGVPTISGSKGEIPSEEEALKQAELIGFPILIKAASGGGGKGMKVAQNKEEVPQAWRLARHEALANFGNDQVYMERYLQAPRHIEFQILADAAGHVVCLGERDCSIQRNHQKIWEEAPALLPERLRKKMESTLIRATQKLGYVGVGTFEMLLEDGQFYFMEMNTRLQVEHTVTEMITGVDLVKEQIFAAAGFPLTFSQRDITLKGHAIECRINAEDPNTFFPSPGLIKTYHPSGGPGVRVDSHVYSGYSVPPYYDSLLGKLIAYAPSREACLAKIRRALQEFVVEGVATLIPLQKKLADHPDIIQANYDIHWLGRHLTQLVEEQENKRLLA